jgi:hypothetical protein
MPRLTAETAKLLAQELYDYKLDDEAAAAVAHVVGAMATYSRRLDALKLTGVQPPFGYPTLIAEADRIRRRS